MEATTSTPTVRPKPAITDIWWPPSGRYTIEITAAETEGRLVQLLARDSRGAATPVCVHDVDETFYVIDGELTIFVGDERIDARAGDFVLAPKGIPRAFLVRSERAEFLNTFAPAGAEGAAGCGVEGLLREFGTPVVPGERPPDTVLPDPEEFARRVMQYGIEIVGPPPELD